MTLTARRTLAAVAAGVLIAITGAACSAGSSSSSNDSSGSSDSAASSAGRVAAAPATETKAQFATAGKGQPVGQVGQVEQQQVISTGTVKLAAGDVADAAADVRRIVAGAGGSLSQDATATDRDGTPRHAHLVVRVPVAGFADALDALEGVGTLVSSDSSTEDVTTQVLDTDVRVEAERRSIERIQVLFDQATSIADIVKIENELSTRQADLASLEQQQRYLQDQTAMSTIDVTIDRRGPAAASKGDGSGFTAGLAAGWSGLRTFAVGLSTVAGAVLPWLVVAALLGVPTWAVVRRTRRRRAPAL